MSSLLYKQYVADREFHRQRMCVADVPKFNDIKIHPDTMTMLCAEHWDGFILESMKLFGHQLIVLPNAPPGRFYFLPMFWLAGLVLFEGGPPDPVVRRIDTWTPHLVVRMDGETILQYELRRSETEHGCQYLGYRYIEQQVIVEIDSQAACCLG